MSIHISKEHDNELAQKAYQSVRNVPTIEPNDRNRLGYHVWLHLRGEIETLEDAVNQARSRFQPRTLPIEEVIAHIQDQLHKIERGEHTVDSEGILQKH